MAETEKTKASVVDASIEVGAKKAAENVANRALNAIVDFVKTKHENARIRLGYAFERYLYNATLRYNKVRTLATGVEPRTIIGDGSFYVQIGVKHRKKYINTSTIDALLHISKNILITGTGGTGKSILMRYLFMNTANRGEYVPVLLELRKASNMGDGQISIIDLVFQAMKEFDIDLPKEQFEYSLRLGKYVFLLDGYDEVKDTKALETAEAIQTFCAKYPLNPCVLTSRPNEEKLSPFETFTIVNTTPLSKMQAVSLASKIWEEDEKTREFCNRLEKEYYVKHKDFAENPLLLTMMFLTYMHNGSIPEHLSDFYKKSYDALYNAHDNRDKGVFRRDFASKLDENSFTELFSHFCFQTYFKEKYDFTAEEITEQIRKSAAKLAIEEINPEAYLADLLDAVCMLVKDGNEYHFSHRSFQAFFAARYTSKLTDEQQNRLFNSLLCKPCESFWEKIDYYRLLCQLQPERFLHNALLERLREIQSETEKSNNPDIYFLKLQIEGLLVDRQDYYVARIDNNYRYFNTIGLFINLYHPDLWHVGVSPLKKENIFEIASRYQGINLVSLSTIDKDSSISEIKRTEFYRLVCEDLNVVEQRKTIREQLDSIDKTIKALDSSSFIEEL